MSDVQLQWIENQIIESERKGQHVVIFSHHPIFPPGPLNMLNDSQFLSMIGKHGNVKAFFNGHNHLGNYGEINGVPYVTISGVIEGDGNAYGVVRLLESGTGVVQGYERQMSYTWGNTRI